ncbi:MAG TPA: GtrA family protein [Solirubrobacteraceae bacterium]|jgi:putative flippase GtrA
MKMRISRQLDLILHRAPTTRGGVQLIRYGIVVGCGYVLAIVLYSGELAIDIAPYLALGIAFVLNGLFNFAFIRLWAFPPSGRGVRADLARFCIVAAVSAVVNYASFALLYSAIGLHAETSQRLAILIAAPITFLANRLWSFRTRGESASQAPADAAATSARKESYSRM